MAAIKPIFIHETIKTPLKRLNESATTLEDKYMLTGPCAWFDEMNDNGRIYKKDDYLEKIKKLQEEINLGLHGEIEHTDDSEPSMVNSSHCIKKLWYDEAQDCVMITIQLLNTEKGKVLMAMVDADMPIYISSRAAGFIDEDTSEVSLDDIYTYDVVRRPGFKNAKLDKVNESKIKNKDSSEKSNISIYYNESKQINNQKGEMDNFVTKDELKLFSDNIQQMISNLKIAIKENKSVGGDGKTDFTNKRTVAINERHSRKLNEEVEQKLTDITNYLDKVTSQVNTAVQMDENNPLVQYAELIGQKVNAQSDYLQLIADKMNGIIAFLKDSIANPLNLPDDKIEDLRAEMTSAVGAVSEYAELIGKKVNLQESKITKANALAEKLKADNKFLNENFDKIYLQAKKNSKFINESAKKVDKIDSTITNKIISTIKQVGGKMPDSAKGLEMIKELQNGGNSTVQAIIAKYTDTDIAKKVMDSLLKDGYDFSNEANENKRKQQFAKGELTKNIDKVLESIKKQKIDQNKSITAIKYPFINLADEQSKAIFESLSDIKKQKVSQVITEKKITKRTEIADVIQQINEDRGFISVLSSIPKNLKPLWENCSQETRQRIARLSTLKTLRDEDEKVDFWNNVDFGVVRRQKVDESNNFGDKGTTFVDELGYSVEDVDQILGLTN